MTYKEIVKGLEEELHHADYHDLDYADSVPVSLLKNAYNLINLQQAEIEGLDREKKITAQDVIDIINDVTWSDNGRHYPYIPQARNMRILALEKQIPKRPVKSETQDMRYVTIYSCPVCSKAIVGTNIVKWCFHCGQKLDWSDEK